MYLIYLNHTHLHPSQTLFNNNLQTSNVFELMSTFTGLYYTVENL